MKSHKGQASIEYLLVFVMGFVLLLSLSGIFYSYLNYNKNKVDNRFIEKVGEDIISNIEKVYFLGVGNQVTLEMNLPSNILNFSIFHINNSLVNGKNISYDYLNVTYLNGALESSAIFETSEPYIRFTCDDCQNITINKSLAISYYQDPSLFNGRNKRIKIRFEGDKVVLEFMR